MRHSFNRRKVAVDHLQVFFEDKEKVTPPCEHFGSCGGCDLQDYAYEMQAAGKKHAFLSLVEEKKMTRTFSAVEVQLMVSPKSTAYRQKMDFVCAFGKSGLRGSSFSEVVSLNSCHLIENESFTAYNEALKLAKENGLIFYDFIKHTGFLRYITVRRTRLGQQLVSFLTTSRDHEEKIEIIAGTLLSKKLVDSFTWQIQDAHTDTSFGEPYKFWGKEFIQEEILGYRFNLAANTFFQANLEIAQEAYRLIAGHAESFKPETILDLYSGTCTIGICLSKSAQKIVAIENFIPNRDMALLNFQINKITNIDYLNEDVNDYMANSLMKPDYVVCNPPRTGVDEKPLRKLVEMKPRGISYLSCNPKTLLEDLNLLSHWYEIESALVLDMFPQTKHYETLVQLKLK